MHIPCFIFSTNNLIIWGLLCKRTDDSSTWAWFIIGVLYALIGLVIYIKSITATIMTELEEERVKTLKQKQCPKCGGRGYYYPDSNIGGPCRINCSCITNEEKEEK